MLVKKMLLIILLENILLDQDRGLEELSRIIGRQRQIAQTIGDEVESQNGILLWKFSQEKKQNLSIVVSF